MPSITETNSQSKSTTTNNNRIDSEQRQEELPDFANSNKDNYIFTGDAAPEVKATQKKEEQKRTASYKS